jgi:hypothetical protein
LNEINRILIEGGTLSFISYHILVWVELLRFAGWERREKVVGYEKWVKKSA